jgi:hypothetical protein
LVLSNGQIPMVGNGEGFYKHPAGENWASDISRLKLWKHGTGMDHIALEPITYPISQVGYNTVLVMYKKNEYCQSINACKL